ncbi:MAG TPA: penicillin-binding protein 1C [Methylibium sp.]|uniref:penicillin-binding protein 1C n=1 Tax=Methylibium sp. TaxID=2067992 RepID=UPI002DB63F6A|nr:penicillin-binding protein 1C [Methylibium sp.]HEU4457955.1 penicillin-binding protein 1C [Methylibium sp.]
MKRRIAWAVAAASCSAALALPSFDDVKAAHRPSDLRFVDRHGSTIQTLRTDRSLRRLDWVALEELSPALTTALVQSEDRRFFEHGGVDWGAVARSAWGTWRDEPSRGASTLTMQLAGLLDAGLARPARGRSVGQKLGQVAAARELEARWSKRQILEAYLNLVGWRGELVGVGALAQTLYGKYPSGLDAQEAAVAVALLRGPQATPDRVAQRACAILKSQRLDCAGVAALAHDALARSGAMPLGEQLAPHFARALLREGAAIDAQGRVRTTLDARVQRTALAALRRQMAELQGRNVEDGAVLVLDNASGDVIAWVGSSGRWSDAPAVDGVLARRQPGSTLKPFVYGLAFERRLITPATPLDDAPAQFATAAGLYLPQNYDRDHKGWVSARAALGSSLNVPAVRVAAMLGPDAVFERLNAFGLGLRETGGYHGHALALGAADTTLAALTNAYRALARGGVWAPVALGAAGRERRVAAADASWLVADILADDGARAQTFGLASALATRGFAAVKTGTSKDLRDNWCIGFTDRYTVGVWIGNASGAPMHAVSGISGAAPVWQQVVAALHADRPSRAAPAPAGLERTRIEPGIAREAARDEWLLAGTAARPVAWPRRQHGAPPPTDAGAPARVVGIAHPRDGSVFALDPDIPPALQRLRFEGEPGIWWLDGRRLAPGAQHRWLPRPGRHELKLVGADDGAEHVVRFEVRGPRMPLAAAR